MDVLPSIALFGLAWLAFAFLVWMCVFAPIFRSGRRADLVVESAVALELDAWDGQGRPSARRTGGGGAWEVGAAGAKTPPLRVASPPPGIPEVLRNSGYAGLVFARTIELTRTLVGVEKTWILVRDSQRSRGDILAAASGLDDDLIGRRLSPEETPGGDLELTGSVPILLHGAVGGTLCTGTTDHSEALSAGQLELLAELAQFCGAALDQHGHLKEAEQIADLRVNELQGALEDWDGETAAHSEHVVDLALGVGKRLGLSRPELIELELGARLHDVGKLRVPGSVLRKEGPLTPDERTLVQRHSAWGGEMVARIPALQAVAGIVQHHHERYDGRGYPSSLAGERIPLASRILGTCDAFSAMTRNRPYRGACPEADAVAELWAHAGTQFDPSVVEALADTWTEEPSQPRHHGRLRRRRPLALAASTLALVFAAPAAAAAECPGADTGPGEATVADLETASECLVNQERSERGLRPLRVSERLEGVGSRHAADMVQRGYFAHTSPEGTSMSERILRSGYVPFGATWMLGENLAWGSGDQSTPRSRVQAWLESPPHRRVMLHPRFDELGIGVTAGSPQPTRFSGAATYAAEFGTWWGAAREARTSTVSRDRWKRRSGGRESRSFSGPSDG